MNWILWDTATMATDPNALRWAADTLGDRWVLLLLDALATGPQRFSDLGERIPEVASNVLAARLRLLEQRGLVATAPYSSRPRRVTYELTEAGREAASILPALAAWSARHGGPGEPARHSTCGSALEVVRWCPTCRLPVDQRDDETYWV